MDPSEIQQQHQEPNIPYDVLTLPSRGITYPGNLKTIKVTYLTAADEDIMTSPNLAKNNTIVDTLLRRKVLEPGFDTTQLLECDKEAILIFLRNTAYGPTYNLTLTDPETQKSFEADVDLSSLSDKDITIKPNEKGEFEFVAPVSNKKIMWKFLTAQEEKEIQSLNESYKNSQVIPLVTKTLEKHITEVEGMRDKSQLSQIIQLMPIKDSQSLRKYINSNKPGLDLNVTVTAPSGRGVNTRVAFGSAFFRPFIGL
tara:strand:+ start:182 stop:946 length:765 start_codon:yes stop_codon:yes gene_type:complete